MNTLLSPDVTLIKRVMDEIEIELPYNMGVTNTFHFRSSQGTLKTIHLKMDILTNYSRIYVVQECIPVGCVPARGSSRPWGGSASVHAGIHNPPQVWAWRPPLCVGRETPPSQTPQLRPWVWAWRPPPMQGMLGYHLQGMLGYHSPLDTCKACWDTTCNACWNTTPSCEQNS